MIVLGGEGASAERNGAVIICVATHRGEQMGRGSIGWQRQRRSRGV